MGKYMGIVRFVLVAATLLAFVASIRANKQGPSPRSKRKAAKWWILIVTFSLAQIVTDHLPNGNADALAAVTIVQQGAVILLALYWFSRPPKEADARENYRSEPGLCGRCDFNLTGNTTGVCPECGWILNDEPLAVDHPDWIRWWVSWPIEFLVDWKRTLKFCMTVCFLSAVAGLPIAMITGWWALLLLYCLVSVLFLMNAVRVAQYGWRQAHSNPPPSPSDTIEKPRLLKPEDCRE